MKDRSKCAILVPIASVLEPQTDELLRVLVNRGYVVRTLRGSSQVDLARSTLATDALVDGFEETLWIDSDMSFNPDDVDRIRKHDLPFVAGFYPCKGPKRFAGKFPPDQGQATFGKGGGLITVEYVGMGFTYVKRHVYERVSDQLLACTGGYGGKRVIPFFIPTVEQGEYLSEDYSFSLRAAMEGFPPIVDTTIKVGHIGKKVYTWDDLAPDIALESLVVEQVKTGEIQLVSSTEERVTMIKKDDLLTELANLEQQKAQAMDGIAAADRVRQDNVLKLEAVGGAIQMVQHLIGKIDKQEEQSNKGEVVPNKECVPSDLESK